MNGYLFLDLEPTVAGGSGMLFRDSVQTFTQTVRTVVGVLGQRTTDPQPQGPFIDTYKELLGVRSRSLRDQASKFLAQLEADLYEEDTSLFPQFYVTETEGGSLLLELSFPGRRFGFNFEPESTESGWYFASSLPDGVSCADGSLGAFDVRQMLSLISGSEALGTQNG